MSNVFITTVDMEEQLAEATDNPNKFPGMSYAEGVAATLRWVMGEEPSPPMED